MSKQEIKRQYIAAQLDLSHSLLDLMFDHNMSRGEALRYLGL